MWSNIKLNYTNTITHNKLSSWSKCEYVTIKDEEEEEAEQQKNQQQQEFYSV